MYGYSGKLLEIDLSNEKINEAKIDEEILRQYIGGRGLAAKILWDKLGTKWDSIDPLEPENILLMLTGPLTGFFPGGRICISGKSPQSNGIVGSTIGGEFGVELKCAGYDGIIISGKAEKPCYISILDSLVEIKQANHIWGKEAKETLKTLVNESRMEFQKSKLGKWREPAILYIGPAGERKVRLAAVMSKLTHAAGYGGYGAVMGSKNLKAVLVKGTGPLPEVFNMDEVNELIKTICKECYDNQALFRQWGTGYGGYYFGNATSSEPIKNWQEEWHDEKSYSVTQFERFWIKRYWGDFGCPTTCLKISAFRMNSKNIVGDNPDYELQAYLGTNLGIFDPVKNIYLSNLIDELGLCGINTGNILGFAGELYEKGILTGEDLDGLELTWGNIDAFASLTKKIAYREGIGDVLAEGVYRAALKLSKMKGKDLLKYAVQSKAIAIGAHGVRSGLDYTDEISYACSTQGGDHTSVAKIPLDHPNSELTVLFYDSSVICWFNDWAIRKDLKWKLIKAVTGWDITEKKWYEELAPRILSIQRILLLIGGPDVKWLPLKDDDDPPRFYEPLPSGPKVGRHIDKKKFEKERKEYYQALGWNEEGIPTTETLVKLGLNEMARFLKEKLKNFTF